ncbi:MAG: glycosyltransferase family 9 protein [Cytophagales bacterium]
MKLSKIKNAIQRAVINAVCVIIDAIGFIFIKQQMQVDDKENVLIIRPDAIGDFVVWSNSASTYLQLYPPETYKIVLLGNENCEEIALKSGFFDVFIPFDRIKFMLNWGYRFEKWKLLTTSNYHTIIYPTYSREFATGDLVVNRLNAQHKIGIASDTAIDSRLWTNISNAFYTKLYKLPNENGHELLKNEVFINQLGLKDFKASIPDLAYCSSEANILDLNNDIAQKRVKYFVIFPGARVGIRQWSAEKFAEIADYIFENTGWKGVLLGSSSESEICENVLKCAQKAILMNLAGKTSLLETIDLIGKANFFIGNETSGIHIAIAQNTPSLCIVGGGHFGRFMPYPAHLLAQNNTISAIAIYKMPCFNCDWNCIYKIDKNTAAPCVENISVEIVKVEIDIILKKIQEAVR